MPVTTRSRAAIMAPSTTNSAGTDQVPTTAAVCKDVARGAADDRATAHTRSAKSDGTLKPNINTEGKPPLAQTHSTNTSVEGDVRERKRRRLDNESRDTSQSPGFQGPLPQEPAASAPKSDAPTKRHVKRGHGWAPRKRKCVRKQARVKVFSHANINENNGNYEKEVDAMTSMLKMSKKADDRSIGIFHHERERVRKLEPSVGSNEVQNAAVEAGPPQPVVRPLTERVLSDAEARMHVILMTRLFLSVLLNRPV